MIEMRKTPLLLVSPERMGVAHADIFSPQEAVAELSQDCHPGLHSKTQKGQKKEKGGVIRKVTARALAQGRAQVPSLELFWAPEISSAEDCEEHSPSFPDNSPELRGAADLCPSTWEVEVGRPDFQVLHSYAGRWREHGSEASAICTCSPSTRAWSRRIP